MPHSITGKDVRLNGISESRSTVSLYSRTVRTAGQNNHNAVYCQFLITIEALVGRHGNNKKPDKMSAAAPASKNENGLLTKTKVQVKRLTCFAARGWLLFCLGWCLSILSLPAHAQTVRTVGPFDIYFYNSGQTDEDGSGTQNWTSQEIDDATSSIVAWANRITNIPGRQVKLHLFWESLGGSILGETSNPGVGNGTTCWTNTERVWRTGVDYSGSTSYDARIAFSTGINWNFGSGTPVSGYYDFRSVLTHELGHTLGFFSTYNYGTDKFSSAGLSEWDKKLRDDAGNQPLAGGTGTLDNFKEVDNPVWFTGSNAVTYLRR